MKWLTAAVIGAALLWVGFWAVSAWQTRQGIEAWFAARQNAGWHARYDAMRVVGFPNRIDIRFDGLALEDPDRGLAWSAPSLDLMRLVYRPGRWIVAFPPEQRFGPVQDPATIASDGLRASVSFASDGRLVRAGFEADTLTVENDTGTTALAGLLGGVAATGASEARYQIGITADAAAGTTTGVGDGIALRTDVTFDMPWRRDVLTGPTPQPSEIAIERAEYRLGSVFLRLAGGVTVDGSGRPTGEFTLRAENWQDALAQAVEAGTLPDALADAAADLLTLIAGLSGTGESVDVPIAFRAGQGFVGLLPIGPAPRFSLP